MALRLFEHNEKAYRAAIRMMEQYGKAAIVHPTGTGKSYIAELAGDKKMARAVGNALHKNPDPLHIPCYRVVNSKGELAGEFAFGGAGKQAELLMADGIEVVNGRVDLKKYGMKF